MATFDFCGHLVYNTKDIYDLNPAFFKGMRTILQIVDQKHIPPSQYFWASYSKKDGWKLARDNYLRRHLLIKIAWVEQNVPGVAICGSFHIQHKALDTIQVKVINNKHVRCIMINNSEIYCAKDIANVINLSSTTYYLSSMSASEKHLIQVDGRGKPLTFLTRNAVKGMLSRSRKILCKEITDAFDMDIIYTMTQTLEQSTIGSITKVFKNEEMTQQHRVGKYRIDLFFPKYNLAIECDEQYHDKNPLYHAQREHYIRTILKCHFIRYRPYAKDFDIFEVIHCIYAYIKSFTI